MTSYSTETIDSTESLAIAVTRDQYVHGEFDHSEFERRLNIILGFEGAVERERVLTPAEVVDITSFGQPRSQFFTSAWEWPS